MNTVDRLRADIDAGRTRDKVPGLDPAAAPLGTDEEAAGTPLSQGAVAAARSEEVDTAPRTREDGGVFAYVIAVAAIAIGLIGGMMFMLHES